MQKAAFVVFSAVALATLVKPAQAEEKKPFTLGYSAGYLTDPFQSIELHLALDAAQKAEIKTLPVANANGDADWQIKEFRSLIESGAQAIVAMPTDSSALKPALDYAKSKSIPVVTIDNGAEGGDVFMVVRADNVRMGRQACEAIGKALGGKGKVLVIAGDQATSAGRERTLGFNACAKDEYPGLKIDQRVTDWKTNQSIAAANSALASTPDLSAIYLQSDSVMLPGVLDALGAAKRLAKAGEPKHIFVVTVDGTPYALSRLRDGAIDAVIAQPVDLYAKYAVYYAQAAIDGKTFQAGPTDHGSRIAEFDGSPMDLLPAKMVTSANADDPTLWGNETQ